jgi:hypothetical protein
MMMMMMMMISDDRTDVAAAAAAVYVQQTTDRGHDRARTRSAPAARFLTDIRWKTAGRRPYGIYEDSDGDIGNDVRRLITTVEIVVL